jgi:hypothetical protein
VCCTLLHIHWDGNSLHRIGHPTRWTGNTLDLIRVGCRQGAHENRSAEIGIAIIGDGSIIVIGRHGSENGTCVGRHFVAPSIVTRTSVLVGLFLAEIQEVIVFFTIRILATDRRGLRHD